MIDIVGILEAKGPLTGKELLLEARSDVFSLWCACNRSDGVITRSTGKRYLRLDVHVEGYARFSPSIMREFLSYTVIGTEKQAEEVSLKAEILQKEIEDISKRKFELAQKAVERVVNAHEESELIKKCACFMIAGDVVYGMAHEEPRPEISSGELIKGSDLDIIIVLENLPGRLRRSLDSAVYEEKYRLLINPAYREEIDYIIKDISRVREQLQFKDFKSMVACKILHEARFLHGSYDLFCGIKKMMQEEGISKKILAQERKAAAYRENAESYLLKAEGTLSKEEAMKFFYTTEEKQEIF